MENAIKFIDAVVSLRPNSIGKFSTCGEEITEWSDPSTTQPTNEEVMAEVARQSALEPLNKCKAQAKTLLANSDWSVLPDVQITNKAAFESYRATLRSFVFNPIENPTFPTEPTPIWS